MMLKNPMRGVIPPMVTPLSGPDALDVASLERLIEHIIDGGVHGLFILGTTGEAPSLSYDVRRELIRRTCRQVRGRIPILVGVTDSSSGETRRLAGFAADNGASALVLAAPFYFPIAESELAAYFGWIVPQLPLPVFLYNMPTHTKVNFGLETICSIMQIDNAVGMKDSSPGAVSFHEVHRVARATRPEFSLLIGPEELMSSCVRLGADGGVCGGANAFPRVFVDLFEASASGDEARTNELQATVLRLGRTVYSAGGPGYCSICGIKRALACMGICRDDLAPPLRGLSPEQRERIDSYVRAIMTSTTPSGSVEATVYVRASHRAAGKRGEEQVGGLVQ